MDNLLYLYTEPFDIVVDPFAGGGSTIAVGTKRRRISHLTDLLVETAAALGLDPPALPPLPPVVPWGAAARTDHDLARCRTTRTTGTRRPAAAPTEDPPSLPPTEMPPIPPVQCVQMALYVMGGGGTIGRRAAEHPALFRIPPGTPRLPYPRRRISHLTDLLVETAQTSGLDPRALPPLAGPRLVDLTRCFRSMATAYVNDQEGWSLPYDDDGYYKVGPILSRLWECGQRPSFVYFVHSYAMCTPMRRLDRLPLMVAQ